MQLRDVALTWKILVTKLRLLHDVDRLPAIDEIIRRAELLQHEQEVAHAQLENYDPSLEPWVYPAEIDDGIKEAKIV